MEMMVETRPRLNFVRVAKWVVFGIVLFGMGFGLRDLVIKSETNVQLMSPLSSIMESKKPENPYLAFRFSALRSLQLTPGKITFHQLTASEEAFSTYLVSWQVPNLVTGKSEKVTGQVNIPNGNGPFPILVMLRGYVEKEDYTTGVGTKNGAAAFAKSGYITIAPDFLGYGGSDAESNDVLISRFEKPVTVLQLLKNLESLSVAFDPSVNPSANAPQEIGNTFTTAWFDTSRIGIWAHSNGGQIALSVLEITSRALPTTLWAPVSRPFPYSVLFFNDDLDDGGAYFRKTLANFEQTLDNDVREYSILNEPSRILAPVQIHQGGRDDAVPAKWSEMLAETLEDATVSATLYTYPNADHNMVPDWNMAIQRDLQFFAKYLR